MKIIKDLTGMRFGRLVVTNPDIIMTSSGKIRWYCVCDCGSRTTVIGGNLTRGNTASCGCLRAEKSQQQGYENSAHGMAHTPEYGIWYGMIRRCTDLNYPRYFDYGGRGITVCDRWLNSFEAFYEDMGPRPSPDHSIDRKENDLGYYKENCRWVTKVEQNNNTRANVFHEYRGKHYTIPQLARLSEAAENGICESTLAKRIKRLGWSVEKAMNTLAKKSQHYTHNGITKTISEWAEKYDIEYYKLYNRLVVYNWDLEKATNTP